MDYSRRGFIKNIGIISTGIASTSLPAQVFAKNRKHEEALDHVPQLYTPYPVDKKWSLCGGFERYALWPLAGNDISFDVSQFDESTSFYRALDLTNHEASQTTQVNSKVESRKFFQVFVCSGYIDHAGNRYRTGDFFADWFYDSEFCALVSRPSSIFVVKQQSKLAFANHAPLNKRANDYHFFNLPFILPSKDESGLDFDVRSEFLLGNAFNKTEIDMTAVTQLEYFKNNTVAPSHFHDEPVWHEFIYLQGGHMTPDGYYGPGDFIASIPGCKEGPYLSTLDYPRPFPDEWPLYVDKASLQETKPNPWPKLFDGDRDGIYGILFVHYGPFAKIRPWKLANWTILKPGQLGPKG